jgi:signal transduction histidine kinase
VDEALLFVRHDVEAQSISLSVKLGHGLPPIAGDRIQLQQVIVSLIVNGIQAITHGAGALRLIDVGTGIAADGGVALLIHDTGPGIAAENIDRIFDSFFTTKNAGIGIGLAICQSIVTAHGATLPS